MQHKRPLRIERPRDDRHRAGRVGLIALVGFGVGLVWPRLAGFRLVPEAPLEKGEEKASEVSAPASAAAGGVSAKEPVVEQTAPHPKELFSVSPGEVATCRSSASGRLKHCDPVDFDGIARGRIATLSACEAAKHAQGVLSLGFGLDFDQNRVTSVVSGKSTTLSRETTEQLLTCLRKNLGEIALEGILHQHSQYAIFYKVEFSSLADPVEQASPPPSEITLASGKAVVAWDVALVRSSPTRKGEVVARVLQGTRVTVTGRHGDWYRAKYDGKGSEGWIFRTAIGM